MICWSNVIQTDSAHYWTSFFVAKELNWNYISVTWLIWERDFRLIAWVCCPRSGKDFKLYWTLLKWNKVSAPAAQSSCNAILPSPLWIWFWICLRGMSWEEFLATSLEPAIGALPWECLCLSKHQLADQLLKGHWQLEKRTAILRLL